jgi:cobalt-zinc-cadmium efflux system membrane fusion protein
MKARLLMGLLVVAAVGCGRHDHDHGHGSHAGHAEHEEVAKGPHGGRLLVKGDFQVEVTIFERGVPPQYRVYFYEKGQPVNPGDVKLGIELHRLGGRVDKFAFTPQQDYLVGDGIVEEPHSFDVKVAAEYKGQTHRWEYDSYEGRTELLPEAVKSSGIEIGTVGPAKLKQSIRVSGRISANEDHVKHVIPRFPGIVKEVRKRLGDRVDAGEVLATVESNESLQPYEIKSAIAGTIIQKHATAGEFVKEGETIYVVADLSTVWADLNVYHQDFHHLKVGQPARIETGPGDKATGKVIYLSPISKETSQTMLARVEVDNSKGDWRPGLFVTADVLVEEVEVPVAVKAEAIQTFRDWDVVFIQVGNTFEIRPLELGRRDGDWVEVTGGVAAGQQYATAYSFIIKADILKSGASHDH